MHAINQALKHGKAFAGEILNYRKDDTLFWNELRILPASDEQGQLTHFIEVIRDITEGKRVEAALQESEAFKLAIFDSVAAQIAVLDGDGVILVVNEAWRRLRWKTAANSVNPRRTPKWVPITCRSARPTWV